MNSIFYISFTELTKQTRIYYIAANIRLSDIIRDLRTESRVHGKKQLIDEKSQENTESNCGGDYR